MPRTVLFLHSSSEHYGADRQLALIAGGLDRARFTPLVVLPGGGPLAADLPRIGVEVIERELGVIRRELISARGLAGLGRAVAGDAAFVRRVVADREVAIVHSNTSVILGGAVGARLSGVPHVWHVREIYAKWARFWPVHRRVLLAGAAVLPCVSRATAEPFGTAFDGRRVRVVPDGLAVRPSRATRATARAALELPSGAPVVAVLGRLTDWKGQDVLIRALADTALAHRGTVGLLAGSVWPGQEARADRLLALATELGVADRVVFCGFREDTDNVLGAADVVCVPSTAPDPLPGAAIEAAAAGCAVVAALQGGLTEILSDGETGLLVPPGDAAALAGACASLLDDPARAAALGAAAAADVQARYAPERLVASIEALYGELLA